MNKLRKNILLTVVLTSVPLTLHALVSDPVLQITSYGYVGGVQLVTSPSAVFSVGYAHLLSSSSNSAAIGYGLQIISANSSLVVGQYNASAPGSYFVVGNGTSSLRRNAFEVTSTGNVNVSLEATGSKVTIGKPTTTGATVTTKIYGTADIDRVPNKGGIGMGAYSTPP